MLVIQTVYTAVWEMFGPCASEVCLLSDYAQSVQVLLKESSNLKGFNC
jgi:hypothetical protein